MLCRLLLWQIFCSGIAVGMLMNCMIESVKILNEGMNIIKNEGLNDRIVEW